MSILHAFKFMFLSKGLNKGSYRLYTVWRRFGFNPEKQIDSIKYYASLLGRYGLKATFFIPANILEKYSQCIKAIGKDNIEWGIHGYIHIDMSKLTLDEVRVHLVKAVEIFDKCGVAFKGFRAPYLKPGIYIPEILAESERFLYDSSKSILWDNVYYPKQKFFSTIKEFYNPMLYSQRPSVLYERGHMVSLPVSLPDDDILADREMFNVDTILSIWKNILRICHRDNEIFILQLHPERIYILDNALRSLIEEARNLKPPVWMTTLTEIASCCRVNSHVEKRWPVSFRGAFCITGDIDSITIQDFIAR